MSVNRVRGRRQLLLAAIAAVGPLSVLALLVEWMVFKPVVLGPEMTGSQVGELAFTTLLGFAFVAIAYWLARSSIDSARYPRVAAWTFCGLVLFLATNLVLIQIVPAADVESNVAWARGTAYFGALGGLVIGVIEARSIDRAHEVERALAEREFAEEQREWFDYLNGLLRHEILNKANVIQGYAARADNAVDDPTVHDSVETITRQTEHMIRVIDDVRVLIDSPVAEEFGPVNLSEVVREAIEDVEAVYGGVVVNSSVPPNVTVQADDVLSRVFSNLIENAVIHNDAGNAEVSVTVTKHADAVEVSISDNGPGIPPEKREGLFERTRERQSTHGLGLYLVHTLVERYDGDVELVDTGPSGSTFLVSLPRAPTTESE